MTPPSVARTPRWAASVLFAAFAAALLGVGSAAPAQAANPPIAISPDGVVYAAQYPGQLFEGVLIVPTGSAVRPFWVQNTGPTGANLAIAVRDVQSADPEFLAALGISAVSGAQGGAVVVLDEVGACASLLRGVHLEPGQSTQVDIELAMANVGGTVAQGSTASFNVRVNLTSDDVPAPDGCTPPIPPQPEGPDIPGVLAPTSGLTAGSPATDATAAPEPDGDVRALEGDTDRFFQEYFVLTWPIALVIGGACAWWWARRRRADGS
ncbi:hypothetical protein FLP10_06350 [Agromyces intestinalis]|uniref:Uncharacterized protein n=1 Tax=Agromyces intestinalis TaxID=2592652 RepID=A0A5C1YDF0_9MICO|nr:hypothetical protein [Agromyces intestinalis]QEO14086.1 hypothetical protein FLP10_06350 [Agromyces intestinalis]